MAKYHQVWHPRVTQSEREIAHWTQPVQQWLRAHRPHLMTTLTAIVVVVLAWALVLGFRNFRESAANQLFVQSTTNDTVPPRSVLETVAEKYPRTAAGKYADWLLASQYYQENKFAEAATYYNRLSERTSPHQIYHIIATEGEAYAKENSGDYAAAAKLFAHLAKISDSPLASQDLLNAARNEFLAGHKDEALKLLDSAADNKDAQTMRLALALGLMP